MGAGDDRRLGISRRCRQAAGLHGREVGPVVADEGCLRQGDAGLAADLLERRKLVLDRLVDAMNAEFRGTPLDDARMAAGDDDQFDACLAEQT